MLCDVIPGTELTMCSPPRPAVLSFSLLSLSFPVFVLLSPLSLFLSHSVTLTSCPMLTYPHQSIFLLLFVFSSLRVSFFSLSASLVTFNISRDVSYLSVIAVIKQNWLIRKKWAKKQHDLCLDRYWEQRSGAADRVSCETHYLWAANCTIKIYSRLLHALLYFIRSHSSNCVLIYAGSVDTCYTGDF